MPFADPDRNREYQRAWMRSEKGQASRARYNASDKKRAVNAAFVRRKRASDPEFKERDMERARQYGASPAGREAQRRFWSTEKGERLRAVGTARRRSWSQDPDAFAARRALMVSRREPCALCGAPYRRGFQLDHVIPLAFGARVGTLGLDADENLQPLCRPCHLAKTAIDAARTRRVRKLLTQIEPKFLPRTITVL